MANVKNLDIAGHRDDELLCRFLDGEASPEECLAVTERVRHDPGFAKRLESFKANDLLLQSLNTASELAISPDIIAKLTEKNPSKGADHSASSGVSAVMVRTGGIRNSSGWTWLGTTTCQNR